MSDKDYNAEQQESEATAESKERRMYGHVYEDEYLQAAKNIEFRKTVAGKDFGDTVINYLPYQNGIILKATSMIPKSAILKPTPKEIMEEAHGFEFEVMGVGPDVRNLCIGDIVDIKNTQGLSLRPMIPHPQNVTVWRKKLKGDRDLMIKHNIATAEDSGKIGSAAAVGKLQLTDKHGIPEKSDIMDLDELIEIVEHFATEDHNISAIYIPVDYVREGDE